MPPFVAQSRNSPERMQPGQSNPVKASPQVGRGERKPNVVRILTSWQVMFLPLPPSKDDAPRQSGDSLCDSATSAGGQPGRPDATFEAREHRLAAPSFRKGVAARAHPSRPYPNVYRRARPAVTPPRCLDCLRDSSGQALVGECSAAALPRLPSRPQLSSRQKRDEKRHSPEMALTHASWLPRCATI